MSHCITDQDRDDQQEYEVWSQEVNLSGTTMDGRLNWLLGGYLSDDEGADRDFVNLNQNLKPINGTPFFFTFDAPAVDQRSWALFSQSTFALTDQLALTFGGRYTRENKEQVNAHGTLLPAGPTLIWSCGNPPGSFAPPFKFAPLGQRVATCSLPKRSVTYDGWSWIISLDWQVNDDVLATFEGIREHLAENEIDVEKKPLVLGPWLKVDSECETFVDHAAAQALVTREYRKPFVMPKADEI